MCFSLSKKRQDTAAVPIESKKQGFSKIKGYYASGLGICAGCEEQIGWMIEEWKSKRALSATPTSPISPTSPTFVANSKVFHTSFNELAECANTCSSCRVFRQALLLRQPSIADERSLSEGQQAPIKAVLISNYTSNDLASSPELMIKISVNDSEEYSRNAYVACVRSGKFDYLGLEQSTDGVHRKLKQWLDQCQTHHRCDQLDSSPKSPTRLIRILDKSKIQLVRGDDYPQRLSYMILSYCWGGIDTGITTTKNISQRLQFVNTAELPTTIQDAIEMARLANVEYVWIDQVWLPHAAFIIGSTRLRGK